MREMNDPGYVAKYDAGTSRSDHGVAGSQHGDQSRLDDGLFPRLQCDLRLSGTLRLGGANPDFITVFRFVATIGLLTFCASIVQHAIWFKNRIVGHVDRSDRLFLDRRCGLCLLWPGGPT